MICTLIIKSLTRKLPRMIFFMCLSNLVYSLAFILVGALDAKACFILAWIEEFAIISSLVWSCCLAYSVKVIVCKEDLSILDRLMIWYYTLSLLVPSAFVALSAFHDIYEYKPSTTDQKDSLFCYQDLPHDQKDYKYPVAVMAPLIVTILLCLMVLY